MSNAVGRVTKILFVLTVISILSVIASSFYIFYLQKNYDMTVEASCDPSVQTCFARYCGEGECPPNGLEIYRSFSLNARDFNRCSDDSCLNECSTGLIKCEEILCDETEGDTCTATAR